MLKTTVLHAFRLWLLQAECHDDSIQHNGLWYHYKFDSSHEFLTPLGPITLTRRLFQTADCQHSYVPLDAAWGMVDQYALLGVRKIVTQMMGRMIPDDIAVVLNEVGLFTVGVTTMRNWAAEFGTWLETHPEAVVEVRQKEDRPDDAKVLAASLDGTNVRLNEAGPKPGRPANGNTGEYDPTCFKNAMVGTVSWYGAVPEGEATPERLNTTYTAHMPEAGCGTFRLKFEAELTDALAKTDATTAKVLVLDGAKSLWGYVESKPLYAGFEKILDFFHAAEHLCSAANALFGKGTPEAKAWYDRYRGQMLETDTSGVGIVRAIDYAKRTRKLSASALAAVAEQRRFFSNNKNRMSYAKFREKGWPIGSGPVEAAGKVLVKQRLGLSGMFWSRVGGQHVLGIRTVVKSDRWDAIWTKYAEFALAA